MKGEKGLDGHKWKTEAGHHEAKISSENLENKLYPFAFFLFRRSWVRWGFSPCFSPFSLSKTHLGPNDCHSEKRELLKPREATVPAREKYPHGFSAEILSRATLALLSRVSQFFKFKGWFDYDNKFSLFIKLKYPLIKSHVSLQEKKKTLLIYICK